MFLRGKTKVERVMGIEPTFLDCGQGVLIVSREGKREQSQKAHFEERTEDTFHVGRRWDSFGKPQGKMGQILLFLGCLAFFCRLPGGLLEIGIDLHPDSPVRPFLLELLGLVGKGFDEVVGFATVLGDIV